MGAEEALGPASGRTVKVSRTGRLDTAGRGGRRSHRTQDDGVSSGAGSA